MLVSDPVTVLPGVGEKTGKALEKLGIRSVEDLLWHLPLRYLDISRPQTAAQVARGDTGVVRLQILRSPVWIKRMRNQSIFRLEACDESGQVEICFFNAPYLFDKFKVGDSWLFVGRTTEFRGKLQMVNPAFYPPNAGGVLAYYGLTAGVSQRLLRKCIEAALTKVTIPRRFSDRFLDACGLLQDGAELQALHLPKTLEEADRAARSAGFKELLVYGAAMDMLSDDREALPLSVPENAVETFCSRLAFTPTNAQKRVMEEIARDVQSSRPMNRLIQGDVGSGKTVLAFFALWLAARNGKRCGLMAPTQILCEQHFAAAKDLLQDCGVAMLSGSTTAKERRKLEEDLALGRVQVLIGTHALFCSGSYDFSLVITDEQHRFGVSQRARLAGGEQAAHTLILSATPIPRTLALILYKKAAVSLVDELPAGRQKITTYIVPEAKRKDLYTYLRKKLDAGQRAYVVCPLVHENPDLAARSVTALAEELTPLFAKDLVILHGQMKDTEKTRAMQAFKSGEKRLMLATTVIEVGVDVPEATVMVIENADRFGLAQLHQLRGRVGRGKWASECYLVTQRPETERLHIVKQSTDGFFLAEKDLELRGAGELLGQAQHGREGFAFAGILKEQDRLEEARHILSSPGFEEDAAVLKQLARERITRSQVVLN